MCLFIFLINSPNKQSRDDQKLFLVVYFSLLLLSEHFHFVSFSFWPERQLNRWHICFWCHSLFILVGENRDSSCPLKPALSLLSSFPPILDLPNWAEALEQLLAAIFSYWALAANGSLMSTYWQWRNVDSHPLKQLATDSLDTIFYTTNSNERDLEKMCLIASTELPESHYTLYKEIMKTLPANCR